MVDTTGEVKEAGPSIAVQMQGLNSVPAAGDAFRVCESEAEVHILTSAAFPELPYKHCWTALLLAAVSSCRLLQLAEDVASSLACSGSRLWLQLC